MSKSVTKNMMAKMALNILNVVLPLITGPYLAHVLDVELYGQYNRAFALISWFTLLPRWEYTITGSGSSARPKKTQSVWKPFSPPCSPWG